MKFLQELVRFSRLEDEPEDDLMPDDDLLGGDEADESLVGEDDPEDDVDPQPNDEFSEPDGEVGDDELDAPPEDDTDGTDLEVDGEPEQPEDPNKQGLIRHVKGAHLVYKRKVEDGTFEELWQYNTSTMRDDIIIKKSIIAGTDIPTNRIQSPDGAQEYETWSAGNAELMLIRGLGQ